MYTYTLIIVICMISLSICIYIYMYMYMCACMYVCMYVYVYIYIYIHTSQLINYDIIICGSDGPSMRAESSCPFARRPFPCNRGAVFDVTL